MSENSYDRVATDSPLDVIYVIQEETTYTYDRDENTNDDRFMKQGKMKTFFLRFLNHILHSVLKKRSQER